MKTHGEFYADKLMDLANLVSAALIFGQMLSEQIVPEAMALGISFLIGCTVISYSLRKAEIDS